MMRWIVTLLLLGMFWWAFLIELWGSQSLTPSIHVLEALGGLGSTALQNQDQWFQFLTHIFLHGSFLHLIFNSIALYFSGRLLENLLGHTLFLLVFFISGIVGGWVGLLFSDVQTILIGASGAIMGVLGTLLIYIFWFPKSAMRNSVVITVIQMVVPSMIPVLSGVSYAAHGGGLLSGLVLGALLRVVKRPKEF